MYRVTLESAYGKLTFEQGSPYQIDSIEGLSPPETSINLTEMALLDGKMYNSAKADSRTIEMAFVIEYDVEHYRLQAYNVLRVKKPIRFTYQSDLRNVFIDGYVGNVNVTHYEMKQVVTVQIVCPSPYFSSMDEQVQELWAVTKSFHFPFAITKENPIPIGAIYFNQDTTVVNNGDVDVGMVIELTAKGSISSPKVVNYATSEFIGFDINMASGDILRIDTTTGKKTAFLTRNGAEVNVFNRLMNGSKWLQANERENIFIYEVGSGDWSNLVVTFRHSDLYEGV